MVENVIKIALLYLISLLILDIELYTDYILYVHLLYSYLYLPRYNASLVYLLYFLAYICSFSSRRYRSLLDLKISRTLQRINKKSLLSHKKFLLSNINSMFKGTVIMLYFFWFVKYLFAINLLVFSSLIFNEQLIIFLGIWENHIISLFVFFIVCDFIFIFILFLWRVSRF